MDWTYIIASLGPLGLLAAGIWAGYWLRGLLDDRDRLANELAQSRGAEDAAGRGATVIAAAASTRARVALAGDALAGMGLLLDDARRLAGTPAPPGPAAPAARGDVAPRGEDREPPP